MYQVFVEDREHFVGKVEMEYFVLVFGDKCRVVEIQLPDQSGSDKLEGDE